MRLLFNDGDGLAAARAYVSPNPDADELAALTGEDAPAATPADDADEGDANRVVIATPLWPWFNLFRRCERVWRYPAFGNLPLGLDWLQVRALADGFGVPWDAETVDLMQAMEAAAVAVWTEDWKRKHPPPSGRPGT